MALPTLLRAQYDSEELKVSFKEGPTNLHIYDAEKHHLGKAPLQVLLLPHQTMTFVLSVSGSNPDTLRVYSNNALSNFTYTLTNRKAYKMYTREALLEITMMKTMSPAPTEGVDAKDTARTQAQFPQNNLALQDPLNFPKPSPIDLEHRNIVCFDPLWTGLTDFTLYHERFWGKVWMTEIGAGFIHHHMYSVYNDELLQEINFAKANGNHFKGGLYATLILEQKNKYTTRFFVGATSIYREMYAIDIIQKRESYDESPVCNDCTTLENHQKQMFDVSGALGAIVQKSRFYTRVYGELGYRRSEVVALIKEMKLNNFEQTERFENYQIKYISELPALNFGIKIGYAF